VLHADAAVLLPELTRAENRKSEPPGNSRDEVLVADDGHFQGTSELNWNWRIGRQLLDDVEPMPPGDPFVARWYHATAAFMLANGHYAEVRPHLEHSTALTLNDARVVFDRACLFEALGTPRVQSVITGGTVRRDLHANVPLAKQANATAEQTFRQVLLLSPAHVEARIRLARLQELRGDGAEALKTLGTIAALPEDKILAYYAALFEGRAHQSLGRPDLAISHFSRAAEMFPRAQTARLALSHAAMIAGSVQLAAVPIDIIRAMGPNRDERDDPWWEYELGAGRDWYRLLDEMWRAVKR
jgi:tetratricopeptide (TPR) repeat protein